MADDMYDKLGPKLNEVGQEAMEIVGGGSDGLYIYAEVEEGSVFAAVFMDEGDAVRYYDPSEDLFDLIGEAWEAAEPSQAKRWVVMEYEVHGTKFDTHFKYREELNPKDYATDRRRVALAARYGDKPVIYPPIPDYMRGAN